MWPEKASLPRELGVHMNVQQSSDEIGDKLGESQSLHPFPLQHPAGNLQEDGVVPQGGWGGGWKGKEEGKGWRETGEDPRGHVAGKERGFWGSRGQKRVLRRLERISKSTRIFGSPTDSLDFLEISQ